MNHKIQSDLPVETLRLVELGFSDIKNSRHSDELWQLIDFCTIDIQERFVQPTHALELLKPARTLYRKMGIDPTHTRPSSEALFRRIIMQKRLYQVSTIVDIGNLASIAFQLPIGLYDRDKIENKIHCRMGKAGEGFEGIQKGWINLENRICLADAEGPFGNPSSDSSRTSIQLDTKNVLFVIFCPHDLEPEIIDWQIFLVKHLFDSFC